MIVQNFRAKPGTKMASHPEPSLDELLWTAAVARLVLGPDVHVQVPPNLSYDEFPRLLDAGIDDWGGVSPVTIDHVNPEAPWPEIERLRAATEARGLALAPRLPAYPEFLSGRWLAPRVLTAALRSPTRTGSPARTAGSRARRRRARSCRATRSRSTNGELGEDEVVRLFAARGEELHRVFAAADRLRREVNGDEVTYVVTRNVNYTNVCYFKCGFCAFSKGKLAENLRGPAYVVPTEEIVRRAHEAWERGAVEICLQGGIHPGFDGDYYVEVCEAIKRELPDLHVHAFSALEVWQGAATLGLPLDEYLARLRDVGLASLPGRPRRSSTTRCARVLCPDKVNTAQWLEVHETAHRLGLRSTATIMFGHVDTPRSWARHLLRVRELQQRTGGFTELVPLPFVHMEAPIYLKGLARCGPDVPRGAARARGRAARAASLDHQRPGLLGEARARRRAPAALQAGVNDLGGTLMNESISRAAGASHGQELPPELMEEAIRAAGRVPRQRTTLYGVPAPDRVAASFGAPPLAEPLNPPVDTARLRRPAQLVRPRPCRRLRTRGSRGSRPSTRRAARTSSRSASRSRVRCSTRWSTRSRSGPASSSGSATSRRTRASRW